MDEQLQIKRSDVEREALALVGIPFMHQGDNPEFGLDCRGVLLTIGRRLGWQPSQEYRKNYRTHPDPQEFRAALESELDEITIEELGIGDVPLIYLPREAGATHVGVIVNGDNERMLVHATQRASKVVKEPLRQTQRLIVAGFRFRGLIDG